MAKFFNVPFASSGDLTPVPVPVQGSGAMSYTQGYGPDYAEDDTTPGYLLIDRAQFNQLMNDATGAIKVLQIHGFPDWASPSDNGGVQYAYDLQSVVRYTDGNVYYSTVTGNVSTPGTNTDWALVSFGSSRFTGEMEFFEDILLPDGASTSATTTSGWIWANGLTIGDASSNATGRANADTFKHFSQIWRSFTNTVRPIYNSDGTAGTRGISATADWNANKALPVRNMCGVTPAGFSTMGGVANNNILTNAVTGGVDASVFGNTGGVQSQVQDISQVAPHTHSFLSTRIKVSGSPTNYASGGDDAVINIANTTGSAGNGNPMNNVQPTTICNYIIKL